jgi:hypothetical protein
MRNVALLLMPTPRQRVTAAGLLASPPPLVHLRYLSTQIPGTASFWNRCGDATVLSG